MPARLRAGSPAAPRHAMRCVPARMEGVLAAVAGDAQLGQAEDRSPVRRRASAIARRMLARLPSQSSGVWLRTAAATCIELHAQGFRVRGQGSVSGRRATSLNGQFIIAGDESAAKRELATARQKTAVHRTRAENGLSERALGYDDGLVTVGSSRERMRASSSSSVTRRPASMSKIPAQWPQIFVPFNRTKGSALLGSEFDAIPIL